MYYDDELYSGTPDEYVRETYYTRPLREEEILDDQRIYDNVDEHSYKDIHKDSRVIEPLVEKSENEKATKEVHQEIKKSVGEKAVGISLPEKMKSTKVKIKVNTKKVAPPEVSKDESNGSISSESKSEKTVKRGKNTTRCNEDKYARYRRLVKRFKKDGNRQEANSSNSAESSKGHVAIGKGRPKSNGRSNQKQGKSEKTGGVSIYEGLSQFFSKRTQRKYSKLTKDIGDKAGRNISRFVEADGKHFNEREIQTMLTKVGKEFPIYCMLLSELLSSLFVGTTGRENIKRARSFLKGRLSNGPNRSIKARKTQVRDKGNAKAN